MGIKQMEVIPQEFINEASRELEFWLCQDRNEGAIRTYRQYFVIAAEVIWESCVYRIVHKNPIYREEMLTEYDIAAECRARGISFKSAKDGVTIPMTNMIYRFYSPYSTCIGGPVGEDGEYLFEAIDSPSMNFPIKKLLNLLEWFDAAIIDLEETIKHFVDRMLTSTMEAKIRQTTARFTLEPGLEDIPYRYSFSARKDGSSSLYIWIYFHYNSPEEEAIRLKFSQEEFENNLIFIKRVVMDLYENSGHIENYSKWARRYTSFDGEYPAYCETKSAGVRVYWP